jgi:glycosyltransferase involved in cell wall biosynthesis
VATLSCVVPATNRPPTLERSIAAIRAAVDPPEELIVVEEPAGAGPAEARNDGAQRATGDVLVFVDSDVVVHTDVFQRLRAAFDADPDLVAVFGSYDDQVATTGVVAGFRNLLHHHVHQSSAGEARTFWAGLGAVRREAFLAAGGFDAERYPVPSIEDIELGGRLVGRIVLDPLLLGTHLKEWTLAGMVETDFSWRSVPWVELLLERRELPTTLNLGWRERASAAASVVAAVSLLRRRPIGVVVGFGTLVALNREFYELLARKQGRERAIAGVSLHAIHHLTAAAAVPAGVVAHLRRSGNS